MQHLHSFLRSRFSLPTVLIFLALSVLQCGDDDGRGSLDADFIADATTVPAGTVITFTDQTIGVPDLRTWNFPGGTPPAFNGPEPQITYSDPGVYDVTLTVLNALETDTETN